ncbi:efflux RND transporter periplasmic adaptor subunit [Butyrivibrio sp. YAB3001]|uniref:efflux RND transporter periplasmic adaptor subunit n=1 Tax=Butyrivibrio sp. YAB3001 TaxID=1520812 RepID=UPI0008F62EF1|nr:efflux RND transporter periplasmic adaptor subunit [Butyrivibrio sp. YAB3001]SFC60242.1 RND family efflux transporter, MFP subunit [Butyrivibrio sp. YAB3001]
MAQDNEKKIIADESKTEVAVKETEKNTAVDTVNNLGSQQVYEDYEENEIAAKPKKRFKKRYLLIAAALLGVGVFGVTRMNASKNTAVYVSTQPATLGSIENILSVSGTVQSAETKSYFADVTAPIKEVNVKVGDKVSAGDILCTYDNDVLELNKQTAELAITQAKGSYSSMYSPTAAADRKYAEGMNAQQINDRLDAITTQIDTINNQITEKTGRINQTLTDLQKTQADINQNGISDNYEAYFDNGSNSYIYRNENGEKKDGDYSEPSESNRQMSLALQQSIMDVQYALQYDQEILAWKNQITALQEEQQHLQSAKASLINPGQATQAKAQLESTTLTQEDTISKLEAAKEGIKADFNGVVTAVQVVEGATAQMGTQLVTIANIDDVEVTVQISKSDLSKISLGQKVDITINNKPYVGEISKISGTATKNNNGVAVVETTIKVTNPDSEIILGVEANNKIHAQKADNTLVLPYEYVQTDSAGDYVYVVENGLVARKNVSIGIASSTDAQIVDGLSEGEQIITSGYDTLFEGMPVLVTE